ncbi:alpha/beta hydrolase [Ekhidna sp.]|uniref:alpha/beta hydrolase n=1 Tax=Ekhidna sp. TaxID=2608089 RepID=UPI003299B267
MKKIIALFFVASMLSCGDDDGPAGTRYLDDLFADADVSIEIVYGNNAALVGTAKDLSLDIYEPSGDSESNRPLLVLAHGGAFVSGTKTSIKDLCIAYAKKGYVVASIGYRLINDVSISDSVAFSEGVVLTIADMKAAIRYLRNDAQTINSYGVDADMIFAGGVSAGAIMANHVAYLDPTDTAIPDYLLDHINTHGGFEGNTNDVVASYEVKGVLSFSGSLFRDVWVTSDDPPIFMVHESGDPVVPCNYEATDVFPFPILAYGACELQPAFEAANVSSQFILIEDSDQHVGYFSSDADDATSQEIIDLSAEFLHNIIIEEI